MSKNLRIGLIVFISLIIINIIIAAHFLVPNELSKQESYIERNCVEVVKTLEVCEDVIDRLYSLLERCSTIIIDMKHDVGNIPTTDPIMDPNNLMEKEIPNEFK